MRPISAAALLDVWEEGQGQSSARRALALLRAADNGISADALASLAIGRRDWRLLVLREWMFGSRLIGIAACVNCNEQLEWSAEIPQFRLPEEPEQTQDLFIEKNRYRIYFRLPNSLDLLAITACTEPAEARTRLLQRCVAGIEPADESILADELAADVADVIVDRMSEADPQANIELDLTCAQCGHRWQALFDIESFLWSEINVWARRTLKEIHTLARAYGWSERDILNLSSRRRHFYLNLIHNS
jgi:hypothetical protein